MGLFSSKRTIVVSSTVYNMAGPEEDRPDFLKSSLFSAIMSPYDKYLGEVVVGNLLTGPGIKQRSFFNWAIRNNFAGLPEFSVRAAFPVDPNVVSGEIAVVAPLENVIQAAFTGDGEYSYFVEQWLMINNPAAIPTEYASEYDAVNHEIVITYEGGTTVTIPGGDFDESKQVVVAYYYQQEPAAIGALVTGTLDVDTTEPDLTGYTQDSFLNTGLVNYAVDYTTTVDEVYTDGTPNTSTSTATLGNETFNGTEAVNSQTTYAGGDGDSPETSATETFIHVFENRKLTTDDVVTVVVDGPKTTTTTISGTSKIPKIDVRTDTQETVFSQVSSAGAQTFIYTIGGGNAVLDALEQDETTTATNEFFPYIPIRLNNVSITDEKYGEGAYTTGTGGFQDPIVNETGNGLYKECKTAYRKASGGGQRFPQLIDEVEDNDDLAEIDYAYVVYGVSLAVIEPKCKSYLYQFFKDMIPYQNTTGSYMAGFLAGLTNFESASVTYDEWLDAQSSILDPLYGTARPPVPTLVEPETTTVKIKTTDPRTQDYDNRITWISIDEESATGLGKVGAVKGDIWVEKGTVTEWTTMVGLPPAVGRLNTLKAELNEIEELFIYKQTGDNTYTRLVIYGLIHRNFIYGGKYVHITAHEAIDSVDPTGFIVPLHAPTIRALSLVDSTQMATANTFIVFNSYKIFVKKWYQTFLGMLFIIIAVVVIAALINPAAIGSISGALGTNAAVGAGLGLTGTTAIVAGAVANALAAIVISTIVTSASVALFGEKWGAIIGAIATFAITFGMSNGFSNITVATMMTPQNLLALSSALANGYQGYVSADIAEMQLELNEMDEEYEKRQRELNEMIRDLGGSNDLSFDPMQLTDVNAGNGSQGSYIPESLDQFIHRTTMTGSDIVDVTISMVTDFVDLSTQLPQ